VRNIQIGLVARMNAISNTWTNGVKFSVWMNGKGASSFGEEMGGQIRARAFSGPDFETYCWLGDRPYSVRREGW
jgi:hypothetical protein